MMRSPVFNLSFGISNVTLFTGFSYLFLENLLQCTQFFQLFFLSDSRLLIFHVIHISIFNQKKKCF